LSDVRATIAVAQLIRAQQPKLFGFLLRHRDKKSVAELVMGGQPFVYTSGKYPGEFEKTTVVDVVAEHPGGQGVLVFDLRHDPEPFMKFDASALVEALRWRPKDDPGPRLPVKTLKFNRCPAVAPLNVLDQASQERLKLSPQVFQANRQKLAEVRDDLGSKIVDALKILDTQQQGRLLEDEIDVDARLYEGFFADADRTKMSVVRAADIDELKTLDLNFADGRLAALLPLYKARNFPKTLSDEERVIWEHFRERKLLSGGNESRMAKFFNRLGEVSTRTDLTDKHRYLLEELHLYGQSIMPA
jgi:exodeoxyribonuclease-1